MIEPKKIAACLDELLAKRLVFVTGKGGTGKSTFTALLGRRAAARGVRTLLVELDSRSALKDIFGVHRIGYQPVPLAQGLYAVDIDSENAVVSYLSEALGSKAIATLVINNRIVRYFYDAVPAGREIVVMNRLYTLAAGGRTGDEHEFDLFVVDMPAAGHALSLLQLPGTVRGALKVGPVARRARQMEELFLDPGRCAVVFVAIPEEMAVAETVEFHAKFRQEAHAPVGPVVANMVPVPFLDDASAFLYRQARGAAGLPPGVAALVRACDWDAAKTARKHGQLRALVQALGCDVVALPLVEQGRVIEGLETFVNESGGL